LAPGLSASLASVTLQKNRDLLANWRDDLQRLTAKIQAFRYTAAGKPQ